MVFSPSVEIERRFLWSVTLGVGAYKLYTKRSAGGGTDDITDDIGTDVVARGCELKETMENGECNMLTIEEN